MGLVFAQQIPQLSEDDSVTEELKHNHRRVRSKLIREAKMLDAEHDMLPHYGGLKSDQTVVLNANFYGDIDAILASEQSKDKNIKRTIKELVRNMQEMLLMGAGVHTKIFKSSPTSMKIVMGNRMSDI